MLGDIGEMPRAKRGAARNKWREIVTAQEASGQTVAGFCRERGLSAPQFYWWKRRLSRGASPPGFLEVRISSAATPIELRLAEGRSLVVRAGFDAEVLRQVLAVLEPQA